MSDGEQGGRRSVVPDDTQVQTGGVDHLLPRPDEVFAKVFRASPVAMGLSTVPDGRLLDVNAAALELAGRTREEMIGFTGIELDLWADPDHRMRIGAAMNEHHECRNFPTRIRRRSGELRDVLLSTESIDVGGRRCVLHVLTDITAQCAAERSLEEAQAIGKVGSWTFEPQTSFLFASREARRIFDISPSEPALADFVARLHPDDRTRILERAAAAQREGAHWDLDHRVFLASGAIRWVRNRGVIERDARGAAIRFSGTVQDISEARESHARVDATEDRYRRMLEIATYGVALLDREGTITFANARLASMLGLGHRELVGRSFLWLVAPEDQWTVQELQRHGGSGSASPRDVHLVRADGTSLLAELSVVAAADPAGAIASVLVTVTDVTERRQAEELRGQLAAIVECSSDAITSCAADGTILTWNTGAETMLGYSATEAIGRPYEIIVPPERVAACRENLRAVLRGDVIATDAVRRRKDGSLVEVSIVRSPMRDAAGNVVGVSTITRDLSTQRRLEVSLRRTEDQLQHLQKMEAIGALAGGIAHDFNNILSVILTSAQFIEESLHKSDPLLEDTRAIRDAAERAATLTRQLLAFSRRQVLELRVVNANEVIRGVEKLLRRLVGESISVVTSATSAGNITVDVSQLEQVLLNLAVNARDAMPRGGQLSIDCDNVTLSEPAGDIPAGSFVRIVVRDTGTGMDEATRARMFEPFFTTKPQGKGTGLGLATVLGIIQQSGGFIRCESELGVGTSFEILLPRTDLEVRIARSTSIPLTMRSKGETIMVVEDEEPVRNLVQRLLRRQGYEVITAANAGEALLLCESRPRIDLLLTDVVMPIMNGRQLAERIRAIYPGLPVAYMSGYHEDELLREMIGSTDVVYLQKPVRRELLVRKLRELLDDK